MTLQSTLPQRVPMIMPSSGVKPMEVSMHLPFLTAVTDEPLPMWQVMILELLISRPTNSAPLRDTYWCEVPCAP